MKISVIIPHYPVNQELEAMLERCRATLLDFDEMVLVVNQGIGFGKAVNYGLKMATGDYMIVVSNDTMVTKGTIRDLCIPDTVTSPLVNHLAQEFWGCFFCIPRSVYEKVGGFDEQFEVGYFEDDDYIMRLRQAAVPMASIGTVSIVTEGGRTMKHMPSNPHNENQKKFQKKWGVINADVKKL